MLVDLEAEYDKFMARTAQKADIVERLRNPPADTHHTEGYNLCAEAADEIERLRKKVEALNDYKKAADAQIASMEEEAADAALDRKVEGDRWS